MVATPHQAPLTASAAGWMRRRRVTSRAFAMAAAMVFVHSAASPEGAQAPAAGQTQTRPAPPVTPASASTSPLLGWTSVTLASEGKILFTGQSTLAASEGTHAGTGRPAIVFTTKSHAQVLGVINFDEETTSYIDKEKRRALEFFMRRAGDTARRYLFLEGVIRQTTWQPPEGNPGSPIESWRELETVDRRFTFSDGAAPGPGESVCDLYSLIYLMRDMDLSSDAPAPREFITLYRRHLMRLRLTAGERRVNQRDVIDDATGGTSTVTLRERRITIQPLGEGAASFHGLLGMQGDTQIWLDEPSGALVEIDGQAPGAGATKVSIKSFHL